MYICKLLLTSKVTNMQEEVRHQLALTLIPHIGDVLLKKLLARFGSAGAVFKAAKYELENITEIGAVRAAAIRKFNGYGRVDKEIAFMEKYGIRPVFYTGADYPERLRHCPDSPVLLYYKGNADLNAARIVSVVGTRAPGEYGKTVCMQLVEQLAVHNVTVISGMAYGIDIIAHQTSLQHETPTIGVLAHGLDRLYPPSHKATAARMLDNGGLLTEFMSGTQPDRQNFPRRNRIVAGLADATIVVESGINGGSLITADIANSYNRDVFAIPGRIGDPHAAGCHHLIRTHRAALITGAEDIITSMGWEEQQRVSPPAQQQLFVELSNDEQHITSLFCGAADKHIDEIRRESYLPVSQVNSLIFQLEMHHVLKSLPGQKYQLANC